MDAQKAPFMTEFASCWGLLMGSLFIASPVVFFKIKEHVDVEDDLEFSDEKRQDVVGIPMNEQSTTRRRSRRPWRSRFLALAAINCGSLFFIPPPQP